MIANLKVQILSFEAEWQPGWVRCAFSDVNGKELVFIEKIPIVTSEDLDSRSIYPQDGFLKCLIVDDTTDMGMVVIDTSEPYIVSAIEGETIFTVFKTQLV